MKETLIVLGLIFVIFLLTLFHVAINFHLGNESSILLVFIFTNALYFVVDRKLEAIICIFSFGILGALYNVALFHGVLTFPLVYIIHRNSIQELGRKARFYNISAGSVSPFINENKDTKMSSWDFGLILISAFQGAFLIGLQRLFNSI
jgi:hypothetical protein